MKHPSVRELYDYWNARRGLRSAPDRADIEPGAIRRVLADTFIMAFDPRADIRSASPEPASAPPSGASSRACLSSTCGTATARSSSRSADRRRQ